MSTHTAPSSGNLPIVSNSRRSCMHIGENKNVNFDNNNPTTFKTLPPTPTLRLCFNVLPPPPPPQEPV
jgi:hypothetical protein